MTNKFQHRQRPVVMNGPMECVIIRSDGQSPLRLVAQPRCGEDFCSRCQECLACHAGESCGTGCVWHLNTQHLGDRDRIAEICASAPGDTVSSTCATDQLPDWPTVHAHLQAVRTRYVLIGGEGIKHLRFELDPLLLRYERGERSFALYRSIMDSK